MTWYIWAVVSGIVYPWTIGYDRLDIMRQFREYGVQGLAAAWIGKSIASTAVLFVLFWIGHLVIG